MRWLSSDDYSSIGWGTVIIFILLCVICPFLVIPYVLIYGYGEKHSIRLESVVTKIYFAAFAFILFMAPICTILEIVFWDYYCVINRNELGKFYATFAAFAIISVIEVAVAIYLVWKRVKNRINKK